MKLSLQLSDRPVPAAQNFMSQELTLNFCDEDTLFMTETRTGLRNFAMAKGKTMNRPAAP